MTLTVFLILCSLLLLLFLWLPQARPAVAEDLYLLVEDVLPNIEWLLMELLTVSSGRRLIIIDRSKHIGRGKNIVTVLARRYGLALITEVPQGARPIVIRHGVTAADLVRQYQQLSEVPEADNPHMPDTFRNK